VVTPRPLRLKAQLGASGKKSVAEILPVARIWVDTGVFHLDTPFDYWVPEVLSLLTVTGARVQVEFGNSFHEGIVLERTDSSPSMGNLKQILQVTSPNLMATSQTLELFALVATRWAGSPYDVIRSAIPSRVASVDKEPSAQHGKSSLRSPLSFLHSKTLLQKKIRAFWALPPATPRQRLVAELVTARYGLGQVLVIAPDERELNAIEQELAAFLTPESIVRLDGGLSRIDRYRNFLRVVRQEADIILGLRGAVFAPLKEGATIIVMGESSQSLHEPRAPGWNARDVALLRSSEMNVNLILVGYSPSLEAARLIDTQWLTHISSKTRTNVIAMAPTMGELIPSTAFSIIRKALKVGPVLFLVPRKGYGNSVLCNKCRNIALCTCGGRLEQRGAQESPRCVLCRTPYEGWKCRWCQSSEIYLASRGIDRFSEEIGRSFPNIPIINSSGDHIAESVPTLPCLVIATPGAQPKSYVGYACVALLEGLRFFSHSELRSTENSREVFFQSAAMGILTGTTFISFMPSHPIVAAITRWDATPLIKMELREREEMNFPPYFRFICLDVATKDASRFHEGLVQAKGDTRLDVHVHISGPHERTNGISRIILSTSVANAPSMVNFVHELQRRRSISRKPPFAIRVDPYSLT
jgi:primosomal protein N' (replication factor Y)